MHITNKEQLRKIYGWPKGRAKEKVLTQLEKHSINFIQSSPFYLYFLVLLVIPFTLQFCKSSYSATGESGDKKYENPVSYQKNILPLMMQKCTPCHFPDRGRKKMLNTYAATRENIEDIMYRVQLPSTHEDFMPFKSKKEPLTEAEINLIKDWIAQEMPE